MARKRRIVSTAKRKSRIVSLVPTHPSFESNKIIIWAFTEKRSFLFFLTQLSFQLVSHPGKSDFSHESSSHPEYFCVQECRGRPRYKESRGQTLRPTEKGDFLVVVVWKKRWEGSQSGWKTDKGEKSRRMKNASCIDGNVWMEWLRALTMSMCAPSPYSRQDKLDTWTKIFVWYKDWYLFSLSLSLNHPSLWWCTYNNASLETWINFFPFFTKR